MTEIWLVRHAQSVENAGGSGPGLGRAGLSPEGARQARALAAFLPQAPDLVVVSPYVRTRETAAPALDRFPGTPREVWPVQEFSYLDPAKYDGTTAADRRPSVEGYWRRLDPFYRDGPGAETFTDLLERAGQTLARMRGLTGFTLLVSHGQFLRAVLLGLIQGLDFPPDVLMRRFLGLRAAVVLPNCGLVRVRFDEDGRAWTGPIEAGHAGVDIREP